MNDKPCIRMTEDGRVVVAEGRHSITSMEWDPVVKVDGIPLNPGDARWCSDHAPKEVDDAP